MRRFLRKMLTSLWAFFKHHWAYFVSLIFIWGVPIYMLNEFVALTETNIVFKISFAGCSVLLVVFFAFRKKIYGLIHEFKHGTARGVLLCMHKAVSYGLILGVLWAINWFSGKLFHWWLLSGIAIGIGLIFIIVDERLAQKREVQNENL